MPSDTSRIPIRREPPPFRQVEVASIEDLTPRMRRIVIGGPELEGLEIDAVASSVRLLFPPPGTDELVMPAWTGNQFELANGERAPIRTFTPRYLDTELLELTVDFVLHEHGLASDWARRTEVGDAIAVSGPGRGEDVDADADGYLLAGDETALPAIGQILEYLRTDRTVDVHVEIGDPVARLDLPEHPGATVTWHEQAPGADPGVALAEAVIAVDELPEVIWVAGEAASVQRIRRHLFDERGRSRDRVTVRGYWKYGRSAT